MDELPEEETGGNERLDGLFREAAEGFHPEFNPADWAALTQQLDQIDRNVLWSQWLRRGLYALLLLLLVGGGVWLDSRNTRQAAQLTISRQPTGGASSGVLSTNQSSGSTSSAKSESKKEGNSAGLAEAPPDEPTEASSNVSSDNSTDLKPVGNQSAETTKLKNQFSKPDRSHWKTVDKYVDNSNNPLKREYPKSRIKGTKSGFSANRALSKLSTNERPHLVQNQLSTEKVRPVQRAESGDFSTSSVSEALGTGSEPSPPLDLNVRFVLQPAPDLLIGRTLVLPKVLAPSANIEVQQPVVDEPEPRVERRPRLSPLSVRLVVTPDLSFLGGKGPAPAVTYGAVLEYRPFPRLVVLAGATRSVKKYYAPMGVYQLPPHWYQSVKPSGVDAACTIVDIPISLRYDVIARERQRWFIGGGVSTYIMTKEDYKYEYDVIQPGIKYWRWYGKTGRYNASHLTFSAGYERALSRRLWGQIEPFVKTPLQGVGYGKVRLLTTGIQFSIRFNL